ncbi:hypothetical protein DEU56DRAFT_813472 [Suillus clintonianus]|uniref:uncharacterized protein n=1 Tax=Suillus clintonianus TaxID=1904413 RepID=UPI001B862B4C|nr:uncharacterized protein DEU56DRAFT_813472 [Suillus clintonianus]KAG2131817.1 hypothetical protein DEU56DRAFT_813472 [Suillus clintonianus]
MIRMQTVVARTPSALLTSLDRFHLQSKATAGTLLFALAAPSETLSVITSHLKSRFPRHIGCLSSPLPAYRSHIMCAVALLDGITFRSTIAGRADPQVGRWHAARRSSTRQLPAAQSNFFEEFHGDLGRINWDDIWDKSATSSQEMMPVELRMARPEDVSSILYFSDKAPEGIAKALKATFPHSHELGFLAASTPFITGRPVTLFYDGEIYSDGAIGIALQPSMGHTSLTVEFPGLVDLTPDLRITSSEGNLIFTIDNGNPTRLLLAAMNKHGFDSRDVLLKDDEFYVGVMSNGKVERLHRIISGDPSRGTIALGTTSAPPQGSIMRMLYLPRRDEAALNLEPTHRNASISLIATPDSIGGEPPSSVLENDVLVVDGNFIAGSENGFVLRRDAKEESWPCTLPGGRARLCWV